MDIETNADFRGATVRAARYVRMSTEHQKYSTENQAEIIDQYSTAEIARKTDFSPEYIWAICFLLDNGEERLIGAVERGVIPHTVAMEIAKAGDAELQGALADAYEQRALPGNQLVAIRRIIEQRRTSGKAGHSGARGSGSRTRVTADFLVRAYRKETDRQRLLVKKATLAQSRLLFVVNGLRRLLDDDHFVTCLLYTSDAADE